MVDTEVCVGQYTRTLAQHYEPAAPRFPHILPGSSEKNLISRLYADSNARKERVRSGGPDDTTIPDVLFSVSQAFDDRFGTDAKFARTWRVMNGMETPSPCDSPRRESEGDADTEGIGDWTKLIPVSLLPRPRASPPPTVLPLSPENSPPRTPGEAPPCRKRQRMDEGPPVAEAHEGQQQLRDDGEALTEEDGWNLSGVLSKIPRVENSSATGEGGDEERGERGSIASVRDREEPVGGHLDPDRPGEEMPRDVTDTEPGSQEEDATGGTAPDGPESCDRILSRLWGNYRLLDIWKEGMKVGQACATETPRERARISVDERRHPMVIRAQDGSVLWSSSVAFCEKDTFVAASRKIYEVTSNVLKSTGVLGTEEGRTIPMFAQFTRRDDEGGAPRSWGSVGYSVGTLVDDVINRGDLIAVTLKDRSDERPRHSRRASSSCSSPSGRGDCRGAEPRVLCFVSDVPAEVTTRTWYELKLGSMCFSSLTPERSWSEPIRNMGALGVHTETNPDGSRGAPVYAYRTPFGEDVLGGDLRLEPCEDLATDDEDEDHEDDDDDDDDGAGRDDSDDSDDSGDDDGAARDGVCHPPDPHRDEAGEKNEREPDPCDSEEERRARVTAWMRSFTTREDWMVEARPGSLDTWDTDPLLSSPGERGRIPEIGSLFSGSHISRHLSGLSDGPYISTKLWGLQACRRVEPPSCFPSSSSSSSLGAHRLAEYAPPSSPSPPSSTRTRIKGFYCTAGSHPRHAPIAEGDSASPEAESAGRGTDIPDGKSTGQAGQGDIEEMGVWCAAFSAGSDVPLSSERIRFRLQRDSDEGGAGVPTRDGRGLPPLVVSFRMEAGWRKNIGMYVPFYIVVGLGTHHLQTGYISVRN